ncbi:hypothetical protein SAMN04488134_102114 [Amphibacillus marinus]|uniref:Uncharacterized protein n=1 Tax=Amphibacillus marinus TaxID=872970 RepID=A0A1H8JYZ1_9BACI|nr:hypothetical protein [Amphibacillus marinus]SEN85974.1 hypothetical protein SAMN04488134_102114 [Amphibacillus marinus]
MSVLTDKLFEQIQQELERSIFTDEPSSSWIYYTFFLLLERFKETERTGEIEVQEEINQFLDELVERNLQRLDQLHNKKE